jgi:hypothetical protein
MDQIEALKTKIKYYESKSQSLQESFSTLKKNPLNLNILMVHVMLVTSILDDTFGERAAQLKTQLQELEGNNDKV